MLSRPAQYHTTLFSRYDPPVRQFIVTLADLEAEAAEHVNHLLALPAERSAEALCAYLSSHGIEASPADAVRTIVLRAPSRKAASNIHFALVCWIASLSYREEARAWINGPRPDS
jgi:hypothetical protein